MSETSLTYTSISSDFDALSWGIPLMNADEPQSPKIAPLSPDYVSSPEEPKQAPLSQNLEEDPEDDPEEDPIDYLADRGDEEEEESFGDDADDEDGEEASKEEDDGEEEEEHLASANSSTVPVDDPVPSAEETEPFKTDESAPTPPLPRLRKARISVRPQTTMADATEALIATIPSPPLPLPSPPLPLPTPSSPLLLLATDPREDVFEANVPSLKRLCLTAPTPRFEVGESSVAATARQLGLDVGYRITDVWDDMVGDIEERASTTLEELRQRVTDLAATIARDTHEMRFHLHTTMLLDREARHAQQTWPQAMDCKRAVHAKLLAYRAEVRALHEQISVLQRQRTGDIDRLTRHIQQGYGMTKEPEPARDPEHQDGQEDAGSNV
ncbi:hypothetical protein Tco_1217170 [Tanacetum coccineum]